MIKLIIILLLTRHYFFSGEESLEKMRDAETTRRLQNEANETVQRASQRASQFSRTFSRELQQGLKEMRDNIKKDDKDKR
jgi:hypothetical protein